MEIDKKECDHISHVLEKAVLAIKNKDSVKLRELSDYTIHSSCHNQDVASITIAVMFYALSKIIERQDYRNIRNWDSMTKKFTSLLNLAGSAIKNGNNEAYQTHIKRARQTLESQSVKIRPYIENILKKASINKGSKLYEHGISMEQTAKLLGISQWELSNYVGQRSFSYNIEHDKNLSVKKRAQLALEFFK